MIHPKDRKLDYGGDFYHLSSRLRETFIVHTPTNRLLYVHSVEPNGVVKGNYATEQNVYVPFEECSLVPPRIGYFQSFDVADKPCAIRPRRRPKRRDWKQGLRKSQFVFRAAPSNNNYSLHNLFQLEQSIRKEYLNSWDTVVDRLDDGWSSAALSRNFAVDDNMNIWCGFVFDDFVGYVNDSAVPILKPEFSELSELLSSEINYFTRVNIDVEI